MGHYYRSLNIYKYLTRVVSSKNVYLIIKGDYEDLSENKFQSDKHVFFVENFREETFIKRFNLKNKKIIISDLLKSDIQDIFWIKQKFKNVFKISIISYENGLLSNFHDFAIFPSILNKEVLIKKLNLKNNFTSGKTSFFLNPEILSKTYKFKKSVRSIIIFMGGTDPHSLVKFVYSSLENLFQEKRTITFHFISNESFNNKHDNVFIHNLSNNYFDLLLKADLAIINGGNTRYECAYLGIPTLALSIHKEQYDITENLTKYNAVFNLGVYDEINSIYLEEKIKSFIANYSFRKKLYVSSKKLFNIKNINGYNLIEKLITNELL